jgi:hypothetical protein
MYVLLDVWIVQVKINASNAIKIMRCRITPVNLQAQIKPVQVRIQMPKIILRLQISLSFL